LQPCTRRINVNINVKSWFPVGRRGGSGGRGRRKPVHGGLVAASMPLTPPQPDPPRLRQFSAICWQSLGSDPFSAGKRIWPHSVCRYL